MRRIQRVIHYHRIELEALAAFAKADHNHVYIIPGNHDAALLFDLVRAQLAAVMDVPGKVHISETTSWQSKPDGRVYAEHGHQIGKDVNSWKDLWPRPFITFNGKKYLKRPWGEKFVQDYYNEFEAKFPIVDNISEESAGIQYARAAEGRVMTIVDAAEFFNFIFFKVSRDQFIDSLGNENANGPEWDVTAIRAKGPVFFIEALPPNHPFATEAQTAAQMKSAEAYFNSLSDAELWSICDELAKGGRGNNCPQVVTNLGAAVEAIGKRLFGDTVLAEHLDKTCRSINGCIVNPFQTFVYSHTHSAAANIVPIKDGNWHPMVFNTGAWQRTISPEELGVLSDGLRTEDVLQYIQPEDLPGCYGVVVIGALKNHGDHETRARLRYWTTTNGSWTLRNKCADSNLAATAKEVKRRRDASIKEQNG